MQSLTENWGISGLLVGEARSAGYATRRSPFPSSPSFPEALYLTGGKGTFRKRLRSELPLQARPELATGSATAQPPPVVRCGFMIVTH